MIQVNEGRIYKWLKLLFRRMQSSTGRVNLCGILMSQHIMARFAAGEQTGKALLQDVGDRPLRAVVGAVCLAPGGECLALHILSLGECGLPSGQLLVRGGERGALG
jgi:hypothetical protein